MIAILAGIGIALAGCTEGVYVSKDENVIKMILGISISILSPFVMQVLYRLTLAPFDIIDLLRAKNMDNTEAGGVATRP